MIIAVIPAKMKSSRLPNKNIVSIFGESLVERAVKYAKGSKKIDKIYVSTDSDEVVMIARNMNVDVIMRGENLSGETPLIDVYKHVLEQINEEQVTHLVGIQPDHPDRSIDVDEALDYVLNNNIDDYFTTDTNGRKNGSLRILSKETLAQKLPLTYTSVCDACTNVHTAEDLLDVKIKLMEPSCKIEIADKIISEDGPTFIIAEAACNHMCNMDLAKEMILKASLAGADAIKFQTYSAEKLACKNSRTYGNIVKKSQYEYYKQFDKFGKNEYKELFQYARRNGVIAFSTPFDIENANMLNEIGMPLFKIASCDLPYTDLLKTVASFGKPIILSTGGSELSEVKEAVVTMYEAGAKSIMLMACTLAYPTNNEDANYRKIAPLIKSFPQFIIGMSDHVRPDENMICGTVYVSLGAKVVEKHYTLDRTIESGGHSFSAEPSDLKKWVSNIRLTETLLGEMDFRSYDVEVAARKNARRSLVASKYLKAGTLLTRDLLEVKRPGTGILPNEVDKIIGKRIKHDIEEDEQLHWQHLDPS